MLQQSLKMVTSQNAYEAAPYRQNRTNYQVSEMENKITIVPLQDSEVNGGLQPCKNRRSTRSKRSTLPDAEVNGRMQPSKNIRSTLPDAEVNGAMHPCKNKRSTLPDAKVKGGMQPSKNVRSKRSTLPDAEVNGAMHPCKNKRSKRSTLPDAEVNGGMQPSKNVRSKRSTLPDAEVNGGKQPSKKTRSKRSTLPDSHVNARLQRCQLQLSTSRARSNKAYHIAKRKLFHQLLLLRRKSGCSPLQTSDSKDRVPICQDLLFRDAFDDEKVETSAANEGNHSEDESTYSVTTRPFIIRKPIPDALLPDVNGKLNAKVVNVQPFYKKRMKAKYQCLYCGRNHFINLAQLGEHFKVEHANMHKRKTIFLMIGNTLPDFKKLYRCRRCDNVFLGIDEDNLSCACKAKPVQ